MDMRVGKVVGGVIGDLSVRVKLTGVVVGTDGGGCHHEAPLAAGENSPVAPFFVTDCRFSLGGGTVLDGDTRVYDGSGWCVA
jgi:hypothetical protein